MCSFAGLLKLFGNNRILSYFGDLIFRPIFQYFLSHCFIASIVDQVEANVSKYLPDNFLIKRTEI